MKRLFVLLLVVSMVALLMAACGQEGGETETPAEQETQQAAEQAETMDTGMMDTMMMDTMAMDTTMGDSM